jgi:hypothetical protein
VFLKVYLYSLFSFIDTSISFSLWWLNNETLPFSGSEEEARIA